jgi:UDP-N-acetylmuramoyl-tripeptide--D-alanyl-D-alanine ligase
MQDKIYKKFLEVKSITTDTRSILPDAIFFALKGENFNGNLFAQKALEAGASMAVVDEDVPVADERIIKVDDVLKALQQLANTYRKTFSIPFLAITGSNGKTTTKELVRDVLAKKYRVHATKGNLNNHIGIPLTLLSIPEDCEIAIIEMGANHQLEIASYCQFTEPTHGLITNMGKAHLEGFGSEEGVVKGKKELYDYLYETGGKAFVNVELPKLAAAATDLEIIPYGFEQPDFELKLLRENPVISYEFIAHQKPVKATTHLVGAYNLYNIASAIAVGQFFGVGDAAIHEAISGYRPDNNRSQLVNTAKNSVIMDAYNANPTSMGHALLSLSKMEGNPPYFIIGDMRELGNASLEEHQRILSLVQDLELDGIAIGAFFEQAAQNTTQKSFRTLDEAKNYLLQHPISHKTILLKGSRGMQLEDLMPQL